MTIQYSVGCSNFPCRLDVLPFDSNCSAFLFSSLHSSGFSMLQELLTGRSAWEWRSSQIILLFSWIWLCEDARWSSSDRCKFGFLKYFNQWTWYGKRKVSQNSCIFPIPEFGERNSCFTFYTMQVWSQEYPNGKGKIFHLSFKWGSKHVLNTTMLQNLC